MMIDISGTTYYLETLNKYDRFILKLVKGGVKEQGGLGPLMVSRETWILNLMKSRVYIHSNAP